MKNKGITLVALVITIIILLILAGIAISQLTNSGLFQNVQTAKSEHENAASREDDILKQYENATGGGEIFSNRDESTSIGEFSPTVKLADGTGFEITSNATSNGNIAGYAYLVNGKVMDFRKENTGYITGLQLGRDYTINVIAMDENGKIKKSSDLSANTGNKTYLYNSGDERTALTGGWRTYSRHGSNATMTRNTDNLYAKNTSTDGTGYSNYYASWVTTESIDLTGYTKIVFDGEFKAPNNSNIQVMLLNSSPTTGSAYSSAYSEWLQNDSTNQIILNIPEENKNGSFYIMISAVNSNGSSHSEVKLTSAYLEK